MWSLSASSLELLVPMPPVRRRRKVPTPPPHGATASRQVSQGTPNISPSGNYTAISKYYDGDGKLLLCVQIYYSQE